ncbi:MAG: hypothetical protein GF331_22855 [Chitinivibrionales bacterium]|nr:hypothetical protein [Chitinivibrionales bacterium]
MSMPANTRSRQHADQRTEHSMADRPTIALLPLYLDLYDRVVPDQRKSAERFVAVVAAELNARSIDVVTLPICTVASEFAAAVGEAQQSGASAIVTLHLAYSPSLESIDALCATPLPLIVLDTTPAESFPPDIDPTELMNNHGIHGVQDLCNLLVRRGRRFELEVGHWRESDVLDRVAARCRVATAVHALRAMRAVRFGASFEGMGDFAVSPAVWERTTGVNTLAVAPEEISCCMPDDTARAVAEELDRDRDAYDCSGVAVDVHRRAVRAGLGVRALLEQHQAHAFSMNFLSVTQESGIPAMPFLEASKAMARGVGYAGEGDVFTASLVGALLQAWPQTTFTEMFCPDWRGNSVFLSHMGEANPMLLRDKPRLVEKAWAYTDAATPVIAAGCLKPGPCALVNCAPVADDAFALIVAPGDMLDIAGDTFEAAVRGWFRPHAGLELLLREYSLAGGTHHSALVYDCATDDLETLGAMLGFQVTVIG